MSSIASEFEANGFVVLRGQFTPEETGALKQEIRRVLREAGSRNGYEWTERTGVYVGLAAASPVFRALASDDRLVAPLVEILGPNVEFLSDKVVYKSAGTDFGSPWHQDWPYWRGAHKLSVWVALDAATVANGCLKLMPGSHRASVVHDGNDDDGNGFGHRLRPDSVDESRAATIECAVGDAVIFHDLTLHASHPNTSGDDRWALISTYRSGSVPDEDYEWSVAAHMVSGVKHVPHSPADTGR